MVVHLVHCGPFRRKKGENLDEIGENGVIEHTAALCAEKPLGAVWKRKEGRPVTDFGLESLLRGLLLRGPLSCTGYGRKRSSRVRQQATCSE